MWVNGPGLGVASVRFGITAGFIALFAILMVAGGLEDRTETPVLTAKQIKLIAQPAAFGSARP